MKKGATKVKLADGRTVWTKNPEDPESDLVEINEEEEKLLEGLEKIQK